MRCVPLLALALLLTACSSSPPQTVVVEPEKPTLDTALATVDRPFALPEAPPDYAGLIEMLGRSLAGWERTARRQACLVALWRGEACEVAQP